MQILGESAFHPPGVSRLSSERTLLPMSVSPALSGVQGECLGGTDLLARRKGATSSTA